MCELMGLALNRAAAAHFSIREFGGRDSQNVDGWGLAWYPDRSVALVKEPVSWRASQHTGFLEKYGGVLSTIYIAHVRHKTVGGQATHADTHPFVRELAGREYAFAHNGTLTGLEQGLRLSRFRPLGATDSEHAFCYLMARIARRGNHLSDQAAFRWLHRLLARINSNGQFNCLFSDGHSLFVYRDAAGYKGLVHSTVRQAGRQVSQFADSEMHLSFKSDRGFSGMIFATHPVGDFTWQDVTPGELIVVRSGATVFSSGRSAAPRAVRT
jgi:predicted glutamine amidotransferase